ncbi:hypothetical protein [Nostoc sp. ChiQUE02]|uniref:hypothetical protein n=1 Tax=Nostoc sp. ChiQUE02 TaxID=3075377 RepID=UPI002AD8A117|nr:hypothetical protein [Nostoc sp. ChiQUE02]
MKDYGDALGDCNESIQINPNNDKAYFLLSGVHFKLGNKYQEIENLQKAARLGNKKAREILKKIQQLPGNQ